MTDPIEAARRIEHARYNGAEFVRDARVVARALITIRAWVLEEAALAVEAAMRPPGQRNVKDQWRQDIGAELAADIRALIEKEPT